MAGEARRVTGLERTAGRVRPPGRRRSRPLREWLEEASPELRWDWPHLLLIQAALERMTGGELRRLMLFVPPRHGKSELVTIRYPVYRLERDPKLRVIVAAHSMDLAQTFSRRGRSLARERLSMSEERSAVEEWQTTAGGGLRPVGVQTGVTGRGADLIVIDDPVAGFADAQSDEEARAGLGMVPERPVHARQRGRGGAADHDPLARRRPGGAPAAQRRRVRMGGDPGPGLRGDAGRAGRVGAEARPRARAAGPAGTGAGSAAVRRAVSARGTGAEAANAGAARVRLALPADAPAGRGRDVPPGVVPAAGAGAARPVRPLLGLREQGGRPEQLHRGGAAGPGRAEAVAPEAHGPGPLGVPGRQARDPEHGGAGREERAGGHRGHGERDRADPGPAAGPGGGGVPVHPDPGDPRQGSTGGAVVQPGAGRALLPADGRVVRGVPGRGGGVPVGDARRPGGRGLRGLRDAGPAPVPALRLQRRGEGAVAAAWTGGAAGEVAGAVLTVLPNTALADAGEAELGAPEGTFADPEAESGAERLLGLDRLW